MGISNVNVCALGNKIFDQFATSHVSEGLRHSRNRQRRKPPFIDSADFRTTVEQQFNCFKVTVVGGMLDWSCSINSFAVIDIGAAVNKQLNHAI